jgi:phosphatidylinositol phospholipase C eta
MKCVVGSCTGVDAEGLRREQPPSPGPTGRHMAISQQPQARADLLGGPCCSLDPQATPGRSREASKGPRARQQGPGGTGSMSSDSSSLDIPGSPKVAPCQPESADRQQRALQGEMNALFVQKLEEIRTNSPMFSTGKACHSSRICVLCTPWHAWAVRHPLCSRISAFFCSIGLACLSPFPSA